MKMIVGFLALLGLAAPAVSAEPGSPPEAVVTEMYQTYFDALNGANASGSMENMPDAVGQAQKYATPDLAARLKRVETHPDMVIDWDFLADGQDFLDLKLVSATVTANTGDAATVRVETLNTGAPSKSDVMLSRTADGWRVSDFIFWPDTPSLSTNRCQGGNSAYWWVRNRASAAISTKRCWRACRHCVRTRRRWFVGLSSAAVWQLESANVTASIWHSRGPLSPTKSRPSCCA